MPPKKDAEPKKPAPEPKKPAAAANKPAAAAAGSKDAANKPAAAANKPEPPAAGGEPKKMHIAIKIVVPVLLGIMLLWGVFRFWRCADGVGGYLGKPLGVLATAFFVLFAIMFAPPFVKFRDALFYAWGLNKDKASGAKANVNIVLPILGLCVAAMFVPTVWLWTRKCQDFRGLLRMQIASNKAQRNAAAAAERAQQNAAAAAAKAEAAARAAEMAQAAAMPPPA